MGALAGGADAAYTHEEGVRIDRLSKDIDYIRRKFKVRAPQPRPCSPPLHLRLFSPDYRDLPDGFADRLVSNPDPPCPRPKTHTPGSQEFPTSVILVRNENCSANYDVTFMKSLFEEEGKPDPRFPDQMDFSVRTNVLGHLLQGGAPSPLDRVMPPARSRHCSTTATMPAVPPCHLHSAVASSIAIATKLAIDTTIFIATQPQ